MKRKGHLAVFENIQEESGTNDTQDDISEDEEVARPRVWKRTPKLTKAPTKFVCKYRECSKSFTDQYKFNDHLIDHIKSESDEDILSCEYGDCDFKPLNRVHAIQHISYHCYHEKLVNLGEVVARRDSLPECSLEKNIFFPTDVEIYYCEWDKCGMVMESYVDFSAHVRMHVNCNPKSDAQKNIACLWKDCTKRFRVLNHLSKHIFAHTKEKYIACPSCGTRFAALQRYSDHRNKQIPIEKQNYKCSQCLKHFATENLLRDHVRAHINQYKCSMCDMTCPKPSNLAVHIRYRHLNERHFKCNLCDHASISQQNLEMHLITHCAEKLLACDECDFKCRSMYGLDRHIQNEHGQNYGQIFECHFCKKQYKRGAILTKHLMKAHGVQWPSGHSRYRYKMDSDGMFRLQTIRYETVDVIEEILKSKTEQIPASPKKLKCSIVKKERIDGTPAVHAIIEEISDDSDKIKSAPKRRKIDSNDVLLTISEVDNKGNVLSQVTESQTVIKREYIDIKQEEFHS